MIDLEDPQLRVGIAIRERIEPRAEHDVLLDAARHHLRELVLDAAAPCGDERATVAIHPRGLAFLRGHGASAQADDRQCERILEYRRHIEDLMCGAPHRDAFGGDARCAIEHSEA